MREHRLRMATYHLVEGLRNLRRRTPLRTSVLATWDGSLLRYRNENLAQK